jgi:hypothetical protein
MNYKELLLMIVYLQEENKSIQSKHINRKHLRIIQKKEIQKESKIFQAKQISYYIHKQWQSNKKCKKKRKARIIHQSAILLWDIQFYLTI